LKARKCVRVQIIKGHLKTKRRVLKHHWGFSVAFFTKSFNEHLKKEKSKKNHINAKAFE
jgi:hypothetical protein